MRDTFNKCASVLGALVTDLVTSVPRLYRTIAYNETANSQTASFLPRPAETVMNHTLAGGLAGFTALTGFAVGAIAPMLSAGTGTEPLLQQPVSVYAGMVTGVTLLPALGVKAFGGLANKFNKRAASNENPKVMVDSRAFPYTSKAIQALKPQ